MFAGELVVSRVDDTRWRVEHEILYRGRTDEITIPAGYVTDFASVPRFLQWFAPASGKYTVAAVLHDVLCDALNGGGRAWLQSPSCPPGHAWDFSISSRDVDGLFRRVMRQQGVPAAHRWLMWTGVRWGAVFNRRRRPGIARDLPLMLALSVLALPLVAPASACIGGSYLLLALFNGLAELFGPTQHR